MGKRYALKNSKFYGHLLKNLECIPLAAIILKHLGIETFSNYATYYVVNKFFMTWILICCLHSHGS